MGTVSCGLFVKELPNGKVPQPDFYDHFVEINGIKYHYTEYPGSGQSVFLLHGFASSTYTWEKQHRSFRLKDTMCGHWT